MPMGLWPVSLSHPTRPLPLPQVFSSMARSRAKSGCSMVSSLIGGPRENAECRMQNAELREGACSAPILHSAFCILHSSERLQVRQKILKLARAHHIRRHQHSRLERRRIADPTGQIPSVVDQGAGAEGLARGNVGEIGADRAVGIDADQVVALRARRAEENL